ncbi:MAG: hypothetical protein JSW58_15940, partial [Candidatus Latescibacterota bacterium]
MSIGNKSKGGLVVLALLVGAGITALEVFVRKDPDGTLLVALTFWTGLVQGSVALAAVGELSKGVWLNPIKRELLSVHPLLLVIGLLSLALGAKSEIYGWSAHPTGWLNVRFFLARNIAVLLASYWIARLLTNAVMRGDPNKNRYAGLYVFVFIVSQSLVAFDWIMSLEYPWISTLFGGYFFIEAFLMGLGVATFVLLLRMRTPSHGLTETLRDTSKMTFGFSVMWVGFFFAQFLVIWYGNIPEEVGYVFKRVSEPPFDALSRAVLIMVWLIPFIVLLSRPLKTVPVAMALLALVILAGLFIEKLVLVLPVTRVDPLTLAIETGVMLLLIPAFIHGRDSFIPQQVT